MPPKASKKAVEKQKQKVIEDKTFGLKNKNKSTKVQKYVQNVTKTVQEAGQKKRPANEPPKKSKAELEAEKKAELAQLFKVTQTVKPGVDPKSVVCEFFKMGMCTKGEKCKFSHDLFVARKGEKIDIYTDKRDIADEKKDDMESGNWDQTKLEQVVAQKEAAHSNRPVTDIICKYFIEALETKKYGWFWSCPNGGEKCQYRHALPPGYVLKEKSKKEEEPEEEKTPLEELIEEERKKLTKRTPVTKENFEKWRADKAAKKKADAEEAERKRKVELKAGRTPMSGKEMFEYHPELFVDDDEAFQADDYVNNNPEEEVPEVIITATGTSITLTRKERKPAGEGGGEGESAESEGEGDGNGDPAVENAELFNADEIPDDVDGDGEANGDGKGEEGAAKPAAAPAPTPAPKEPPKPEPAKAP